MTPADFGLLRLDPEEFSLWELDRYIADLRSKGLDPGGYVVDRDLKYAMPLACVIMVALGMALSLDPLPRNLSLGRSFGLAIVIGFGYWLRSGSRRRSGDRRCCRRWIAAWIPNLMFAMIGDLDLPVRRRTLMPTDSIELLTLPAVRDFLAFERIGHLATADAEGAPHNVPLCYWFNGTHFYFAIDEKPKRGRALALQPDAQYRG